MSKHLTLNSKLQIITCGNGLRWNTWHNTLAHSRPKKEWNKELSSTCIVIEKKNPRTFIAIQRKKPQISQIAMERAYFELTKDGRGALRGLLSVATCFSEAAGFLSCLSRDCLRTSKEPFAVFSSFSLLELTFPKLSRRPSWIPGIWSFDFFSDCDLVFVGFPEPDAVTFLNYVRYLDND